MTDKNLYAPPKAEVVDTALDADDLARLNRVASGQRLVIYALLLMFGIVMLPILAGGPLTKSMGPLAVILQFVSLAWLGLSIWGVLRLSGGLGVPVWARVFIVILIFLPLLNLLTLAVLSGRATKALRDAGYRVGLLGASPRAV